MKVVRFATALAATGLVIASLGSTTPVAAQTSAPLDTLMLTLESARSAAASAVTTARTIERAIAPGPQRSPQQPMPAASSNGAKGDNTVAYGALRYPGDLVDLGGPTVARAQMHAIFMRLIKHLRREYLDLAGGGVGGHCTLLGGMAGKRSSGR